jgi:DNA-binding response OmpR family regulator
VLSTFLIVLPWSFTMNSVLKKRPRPNTVDRQAPLVVCIDDDPHISKALRLRLKAMKIEVLQASNGRDGLRMIRDRQPDLVISDWWMDQGDGEFVLKGLQSDSETAQIPVIMISGVGRPDFMNRMFAQGARACYTKPIQFDALREDLCMLLDLDVSPDMNSRPFQPVKPRKKTHEKRRPRIKDDLVRIDSSEDVFAIHWRS